MFNHKRIDLLYQFMAVITSILRSVESKDCYKNVSSFLPRHSRVTNLFFLYELASKPYNSEADRNKASPHLYNLFPF